MAHSPLTTRDRGFALVGRLNRWIAAAAVALAGGLSIAAANAFHGHTRGQSASTSNAATISHHASSGESSDSGNDDGSDDGDSTDRSGGGLQPPAQAPSPAPAPSGGGVVSGGS